MKLLKICRGRQRRFGICRECKNYIEPAKGVCKCRLDDGYVYNYSYAPWLIYDKYIRCKPNKQCPYILEHLILRRKKYVENTEK